jgi:transcriptional regulator with XRE-family HTH domain
MAQPFSDERSVESVARRLEQTRLALEVGQSEFAKRAGLAQNTYNQFERGKRRLSLEAAHALCDEYRLTLDWLYRGDLSSMPHTLAGTLRRMRRPA